MKATIDGMTIEGTAEEMLSLIKVRGRTPRPLPEPSQALQAVDEPTTRPGKVRRHKHWNPTEIQALTAGLDRQDGIRTIARQLCRTTLGVKSKAIKLGFIDTKGHRIGQEV